MKNINKKKILYYLETYSTGGIEKVVDKYYEYFSNDFDITVLSGENLTNKNILSLLNKKYNHYIRTYLCFKSFNKFLKSNKYDIIHIHIYNGIGLKYAYIASKYCNNVIVHAHSSGFENDMFNIKEKINKYYIKKYSKDYTSLSVSDKASMFCFNKKSTIIPSSFDYNMFNYNEKIRNKLRKKLKIKSTSIVLGHIGRFVRLKNHNFLLKVFEEYYKENNNSYLVLIGDGKLKNKIKKMNIKNVIIIDNVDNINDYYNMFDLFLLPSLFEGFGRTTVEAQLNGLYTIISDSISNEVIISKNVIKLKLDVKEWVDNIYLCKRNNKVNDRLSDDKVLPLLLKIYKE